ncbi:MAG: 50S ribosomal protein L18 [Candidatus Pacebacteria bacterium]|jgi:large subunit ribosomal protein L18|nr:50S ribosomal protein L18 [Candidatus Paceibacterota bacterium]MBP9851213.1 50S ribosomal protein L18 [Candidatus Paceibacterota bacterium]
MKNKVSKRLRLKSKIRAKVSGVTLRPRLSVFRSNKFIYAQVIDDTKGKTLVSASDVKVEKGTKLERAKAVGENVAKLAIAAKINEVVFDRNGFKYTGRIKLVADAARAAGLKF